MPETVPRALTVAGSDSGGGAGIQADLKTFAAFEVFGACAVTAVTAQNTVGVRDVQLLPPASVTAQIDAVAEDIGVDAVKTGMLGSAEIVEAVAAALDRHRLTASLVVDPVMVAKGGDRLLDESAVEVVRERLLPLARCVTPNLPEAEVLTGLEVRTLEDMHEAGRALIDAGAGAALVKGGHLDGGDPVDLLCLADGTVRIAGPRIETRHTHGTGCTLAAAIAAGLARGWDLERACRSAREYLEAALRQAPGLGQGHGPVWHHVVPPALERERAERERQGRAAGGAAAPGT